MDDWEKFNETSLPEKECYDLYVQSETLLLAEVFNTFWNICFEIYEVDPVHFFLHKD